MTRLFYLASSINTTDEPRGGTSLPVARLLATELERATDDRCVSRWLHHKQQNQQPYLSLMAAVNLIDIAQADYVIAVPLTQSSRGVHFEMGVAVALGKPLYLYRPKHIDGIAFDELCLTPDPKMLAAIEKVVEAKHDRQAVLVDEGANAQEALEQALIEAERRQPGGRRP